MSDNTTLPREVVEDVLYALVSEQNHGGDDCYADSITALRTHLAAEQPKPEPVAWMRKEWSPDCGSYFDFCAEEEMGWRDREEWTPLYATPPATHPGYIIGSHWLETAYSRICAGEAEADVLRDCGWERVDDAEALRRDAEQPKPEPVAVFDEQMGHPVLLLGSPMLKDKQPLYTAPPATHPGYVIGSHWLETAYSRICAGEAEADVLRDIGLVREEAFLTGVAHLKAENEALRRDAERYRWLRDNAAGFSGRTLDAITDAAINAAMEEGT